jgi:hypothetical protein
MLIHMPIYTLNVSFFGCFGHIRDNEVHGLSRQYRANLVKEVMFRSCNEIYDMVSMIHS